MAGQSNTSLASWKYSTSHFPPLRSWPTDSHRIRETHPGLERRLVARSPSLRPSDHTPEPAGILRSPFRIGPQNRRSGGQAELRRRPEVLAQPRSDRPTPRTSERSRGFPDLSPCGGRVKATARSGRQDLDSRSSRRSARRLKSFCRSHRDPCQQYTSTFQPCVGRLCQPCPQSKARTQSAIELHTLNCLYEDRQSV